MLMDYLVSDTSVRSQGAIDFPSRFAQGYVYLQSKVYGDRPGTFHGDQNVWLYLPRGLVNPGNVQLNYLAGRGNGNLYLAFTNQSSDAVTSTVTLSSTLLPTAGVHSARVWQENQPVSPIAVNNGQFQVTVAPKGITAVAISAMSPTPTFQAKVLDPQAPAASDTSHLLVAHPQLKNISGMMLDFGKDLGSAYVWLDAAATVLSQAKLVYRKNGGAWQETTDTSFPYEFSIPLADTDSTFEYHVEGTLTSGGAIVTSGDQLLRRDGPNTPEDVVAMQRFGHIVVSWTAVTGATSYLVRRSSDGGATYTVLPESIGLTDNVFHDYTAQAGVTYLYAVSAVINGDEGHVSFGVSVTPGPGEIIVDNADPGFSSVNSQNAPWALSTNTPGWYGANYAQDGTAGVDLDSVFAKWIPAFSFTARYRVSMRWVAAPSRPAVVPVVIVHRNGTDASQSVNEQQNNNTWVTVGDYDFTAGDSSQSVKILGTGNGFTIADAVRFSMLAPSPVSNFTATAGAGGISLSWNSAFGTTAYDIRRAPAGVESWTTISPAAGASGTAFLDTTATPGASYRYIIRAGNDGGLSADSAIVTATALSAFAAWREIHFGVNPGPEGDLLADPDGDGLANLIEYGLGLDPGIRSSTPMSDNTPGLPVAALIDGEDGEALTITYRVDPSKADIGYLPEYSETLEATDWHVNRRSDASGLERCRSDLARDNPGADRERVCSVAYFENRLMPAGPCRSKDGANYLEPEVGASTSTV